MAEFSFGDLLAAAAEAPQTGFGPELDAAGRYQAEVATANSKISSKGKLQIGLKFKVSQPGHPKDGHSIWSNQTLSPESPAALDIFFRTFEALGIPRDAWAKYGANLEAAGEAAANAIVGARAQINVQMGKAQNGYDAKLEVKFINKPSTTAPAAPASGPQIPAQAAAPAVTPPPAAAPAAPAAAPVAPPRAPF